MEEFKSKRKLSPSGEDARRDFITKRLKSVDELAASWRFTGSMESIGPSTSVSSQSLSLSTLDLQTLSRSASTESSRSDSIDLDTMAPIEDVVKEACTSSNVPGTLEMASQPADKDICVKSVCFYDTNDGHTSSQCKLLKQISRSILSVEADPPGEIRQVNNVCDVLAYVQALSPDVKTDIANFLSSGIIAHVHLTLENVHHFFHVASLLHMKQLRNHCINYCQSGNETEIIACFEGCECQNEIKRESATGYQRSQSVVSNPDDSDPPQYYIVFTDNILSGKDKCKIKVLVIDTSQKRNVYNHEVDKLRNFGNGFACCSFEIKGTPFVMVSGGVGKNAHSVMKYDVILGRWVKCAKLLHGRSHHMMVAAGSNSVFALGGLKASSIEEYRLKTNRWVTRASLVTHVTSAVCTVYHNKIYIFGGKTHAGPVATTQCYDINSHVIGRLADLPVAFNGGQAVVLDERIYIATDQGHMIRFNPNTGFSRLCTQQPIHRKQFGMFVREDRIYIVGGVMCDDQETTTTRIPQYRYNSEKDLWVEKNKLCYSFSVLASCIINFEKKCCVIPFNERI